MERQAQGSESSEDVRHLARYLRASMPSLSDLDGEGLKEVAKSVVFQRLARELDFEIAASGIDVESEAALFLEGMGKRGSKLTQKTYAWELQKLVGYCRETKTRLIEFTPRNADGYILHLIDKGYSPASVALAVSVASSFSCFIERRHSDGVLVRFSNPFRGTKVKPKVIPRRRLLIPAEEEVWHMMEKFPPKQASMVALMSGLGLRCGSLSTLVIKGTGFNCVTKGKEMSGIIDDDLLAFLKRRVKLSKPFAGMSVPSMKRSINYYVGKMYKKGSLRASYSCHDFRHYFAVREYRKDKDIWRVSRLLNHACLASTEMYLRGLGEIE